MKQEMSQVYMHAHWELKVLGPEHIPWLSDSYPDAHHTDLYIP